MPATGAPTLESVAARAGVSRATAGRVLSGSTKVSPAAREAVLQAATELHYVANQAARALVTRRSGSVALVVVEPVERFFSDSYFPLILNGAQSVLAEREVQLVLAVLSTARERERFERYARSGHVDGAILVSVHGADPLPQHLRDAGIPVVLSGRPYSQESTVPFVSTDNAVGARLAVRHLVEAGCHHIATVTGPMDMSAAQDRLEGFRAELRAHRRRVPARAVASGDFAVAGGREAMRALLEQYPELDGVFVANDQMAAGALQALAAAGRSVPADVRVVGFDDAPLAAAATPPLTTVCQPVVEMGRALATMLLRIVEGEESPESVIVQPELIVRASA
ncbi:DNA-binding LacI/PurR family transcriptional regulator [Kineococcus xinjiangensis]|uniref:DNA-binding LacI/PurR family transcriptional regulator n=1 Tax=Kineococcus xinjiangensis TaxID=512762 RepID=A0A2S6IJD2_9ACTN|nr:LacI family DNA-binding transcriptional regulator [Kineococcus xinjiangensis]PPK94291.1 DNA-binding LacI/PurR family transcriptional regulator [Kineococcus xinjiangensis]